MTTCGTPCTSEASSPAALAYQVWRVHEVGAGRAPRRSRRRRRRPAARRWRPAGSAGTAWPVASGRWLAEAVDVDLRAAPAASAAPPRGARRAPRRRRRRPAATPASRCRCARRHPRGRNRARRCGRTAPSPATLRDMRGGPRVLGIVLAGGAGKRLAPLTDDRAKPAVPFGGNYRLIDFVLSNLVNAEIRQIAVLTQYKSHSLDRHITADLADVAAARQLRHPGAGAAAARPALVHRQRRRDLPEPQPDLRRAARHRRRLRRRPRLPHGRRARWSTSTCRPVPA